MSLMKRQGEQMTNTHQDIMTQTLPLKYLHATSESKKEWSLGHDIQYIKSF